MKNSDNINKIFNNQYINLKMRIKYRLFLNVYNSIILLLIKSGIAINNLLPYFISAMIVVNVESLMDNKPFVREEYREYANVCNIETSNGEVYEQESFDDELCSYCIKYSTGWIVNENGLFERSEILYDFGNINLDEFLDIKNLSKEEVDNKYKVSNIRHIEKSFLDVDDEIYKDDALFFIYPTKSTDNYVIKKESVLSNLINVFVYFLAIFILEIPIRNVQNIFIGTYVVDSFKRLIPKFRPLNENELLKMENILLLRKNNMEMFNNELLNEVKIRRK